MLANMQLVSAERARKLEPPQRNTHARTLPEIERLTGGMFYDQSDCILVKQAKDPRSTFVPLRSRLNKPEQKDNPQKNRKRLENQGVRGNYHSTFYSR